MDVQTFYQTLAPTPVRYLITINNKRLWVKRDDLNDAVIQGNKLRKLKYLLLHCQANHLGILTFGGAFSNHLSAVAEAGRRFHIDTHAIVRGQELADPEKHNPVLKKARQNGMQLHFVSRKDYRLKEKSDAVRQLLDRQKNLFVVPEGGSHPLALSGASEVIDEIVNDRQLPDFDKLFCACGTGGTLAGLLQGAARHRLLSTAFIGVPVLKGADFLYDDIRRLNPDSDKVDWSLVLDAHAGGYAKKTPALQHFIKRFSETFAVPIEPIYTAKLFKAAFELAENANNTCENWLLYHSGGIYNEKLLRGE